MNEFNRRRQRAASVQPEINQLRAEPIDENPAFILFTHGNFIQEFIKKVSGQKLSNDRRPNYSAFEFTVTLVPNAPPQIVYNGPFMYDFGADANPRSSYAEISALDKDKECEGVGDQCRIRACGASRLNFARGRRNATRRAEPSAPPPPTWWQRFTRRAPRVNYRQNAPPVETNIAFYEQQEGDSSPPRAGGARRTHKRHVRFSRKQRKTIRKRRS